MITVNGIKIDKSQKPYMIAELSANHGGSLQRAKQSILSAKNAGASAIKIQTYNPDSMTINSNKKDFQINEGLWQGKNLYNLYDEAHTPYNWHHELFSYSKQIGITLFSTPFDETAVDLLENLQTPAYKIASFEITDLYLIEYVAKKNKPIFISTGMASIDEISEAVEVVKKTGNTNILLFHCISSYPTPTEKLNLNNLKFLEKEFNVSIGLSDHSIDNLASSLAISLGAVAIEKHFKLDDSECGPDSSFSLTPKKFKNLIKSCNDAWSAIGRESFTRPEIELENLKFRRSIYFIADCNAGDIIDNNHIRRIRPGYGLPPKYFKKIIGKKLIKNVEKGDPVSWDCFE